MKKFFIVGLSVLALPLILTGCAKSSATLNQQNTQNTGKVGRSDQPDFGQPDRQADIRGIVKSIIGNEVTILKIDRSFGGRNASSTPGQGKTDDNGSAGPVVVSFTSGGSGTRAGGGVTYRGNPDGGGPGGGPDGQTAGTRAQMLATLKAMSTGEEKIIIPVGIQMLKVDTSDNKRKMVEATLADITADKNLTIWVTSDAGASVVSDNASTTASTTPNTNATSTISTVIQRKIAEFVLIN